MARVPLYLAVDSDTYLNVDSADFDNHILVDFGLGLGVNQRVRVIRDGSTGTVAVEDGEWRFVSTRSQ